MDLRPYRDGGKPSTWREERTFRRGGEARCGSRRGGESSAGITRAITLPARVTESHGPPPLCRSSPLPCVRPVSPWDDEPRHCTRKATHRALLEPGIPHLQPQGAPPRHMTQRPSPLPGVTPSARAARGRLHVQPGQPGSSRGIVGAGKGLGCRRASTAQAPRGSPVPEGSDRSERCLSRRRCRSAARLPSSGGIGPLRALSKNHSPYSAVRLPMPGGIGPLSRVAVKA